MIGNLVQRLLKKNHAPDWFCADMRRNTPEAEIKAKIRVSLEIEVENNGYDRRLWDADFINRMTNLYYKFFDQLYMQSA